MFSLRFASRQIAEMYRNQATTSKGAKKKGGDEGDDFW